MNYSLDYRHGRIPSAAQAGHRDRPVRQRRGLVWRSTCVWLACALTTNLAAQTPATPTTGVAGQALPPPSGHGLTTPRQSMLLTFTLSGGTSDELSESVNTFVPTGPLADAGATLTYQRRLKHASFGFNGRSIVRQTRDTTTALRQEGGFDVSASGQHQQFHATQNVSYSPYYQFGGLTDIAPTPEADAAAAHGDFANANLQALTSNTDATWSWALGRNYSLLTSYDLRRTNFHNGSLLDMTSQNAGAVLTRRLTRSLGLRTGYAYRIASTAIAGSEPLRVNDVELGLDFSRPLATSRRTTFSFASGSSISPDDGGVGFRVTGNAGLTRLIGRTWKTRIGVDRSVRLLEGFVEPVLTNAVDTTVGGNLSRRVSFSTSGSLSTGSVGLNGQTGNSYQNWTVASGLSFAMGRRAELGAQYFALDERFDNGVVLPTGLDDRRRRRQGVRISITFRAPLLGY